MLSQNSIIIMALLVGSYMSLPIPQKGYKLPGPGAAPTEEWLQSYEKLVDKVFDAREAKKKGTSRRGLAGQGQAAPTISNDNSKTS